ncbi:hypothetical protein CDAR_552741 [Caerostris darwini]|uniref:C2H2-type domain-containing protein n=1 Tax=Caerostris darwini TaxID=1538125 RepID=A0AAV4M4Z6_9ARAC|nr:hypothetical protein CDAR_552741 [Caerostris darwini]
MTSEISAFPDSHWMASIDDLPRDDSHGGILTFSNNSSPLEEKEISLNAQSAAGEDHFDSSEIFTSTSFDLDQFSSWNNFQSPLMTVIDTPGKESPIQMDRLNTSSVMSSKIEDRLGSAVEITSNIADTRSVPVGPRTNSKQTSNGPVRERRYACPIDTCASWFFHNWKLTRHLKIHTGQKSFQCGVCSRSFVHPHNLITHNRVHSGEKPYSCGTCGRRFARSDAKRSHAKVHLKQKTKKYGASGNDNNMKICGLLKYETGQ